VNVEPQAEVKEEKSKIEPKEEKPPKTDRERYDEIQAKPVHKRTMKEKEFMVEFERLLAIERKHGALLSKVTEQAITFKNRECNKVRRRITDKVKELGPREHEGIQGFMQLKKRELKDLDLMERKVAKRIKDRFDKRRAEIISRRDKDISDARAGVQEQYKEFEQELSDSLAELDQAVTDFLDAIQVLGDEQLEKLLKGDPVALDGGDYIVLPGA
jgi:hypothetical protein